MLAAGAKWAGSAAEMAANCDILITCLPSPVISAQVLEAEDGLLAGWAAGKIWAEMSTTDETEIHRLGAKITAMGGRVADCPVSGGCHRAATGNISIFAGCTRDVFDDMLPYLTKMGRRIFAYWAAWFGDCFESGYKLSGDGQSGVGDRSAIHLRSCWHGFAYQL